MKNYFSKFAASILLASAVLLSSTTYASGAALVLDAAPDLSNDKVALQNGAKLFVNYCLNCHAANSMRYNRLKDIGLTEEQIKTNLLFSGEKVGDLMKVSMTAKDAKDWFGAVPPDLSVIARAKASEYGSGADYIYTYLRGYYRDETRPTGWNNVVYPNVGMPHVLWERQPEQTYDQVTHKLVNKDLVAKVAYDKDIADLTAYIQYMGEPDANRRRAIGIWVLFFLAIFIVLAWRLNAQFWKDIK